MKKSSFVFSFVFAIFLLLGFFPNKVLDAMQPNLAGQQQAQNQRAGIPNCVNSCYFNAAMQCLTNCLPAGLPVQDPYLLGLVNLKNTINQQNGGSIPAPALLKSITDADPQEFPPGKQADAAALLTFFFGKISGTNFNAFTTQMQSVTISPDCGHQSIIIEPHLSFGLPINTAKRAQKTTLTVCLNDFFKVEQATMRDLRCGQCDAPNPHGSKQLQPRILPQILILQLNRFDNHRIKMHNPVSFPLENLICKTVAHDNNPPMDYEYALTGFVQHRGSLNHGHYTAYVKHNNQWYYCDDSNANPVSVEQVGRVAARGTDGDFTPYIFFYENTARKASEAIENDEQKQDESSDDVEIEDDTSPETEDSRKRKRNPDDDDQTEFPEAQRQRTEASEASAEESTTPQNKDVTTSYNLADYQRACDPNGDKKLAGANLRGADLSNADLVGADLTGANLQDAILNGADLTGARLEGANLYRTHLIGAQLVGIICNDKTQFGYTNLNKARLDNATLNEVNLGRCNLSNTFLTRCKANGIQIVECNFKNAQLPQTRLENAFIANSDFSNAHFDHTLLTGAVLSNVVATEAIFTNIATNDVSLLNCSLDEATFTNVQLTNSKVHVEEAFLPNKLGFKNATFRNISFFNCTLQNISMHKLDAEFLIFGACKLLNIDFSHSSLTNMYIRDPLAEKAIDYGAAMFPQASNEVLKLIMQNPITYTLLGENLNFEHSTIRESIIRGRRKTAEQETKMKEIFYQFTWEKLSGFWSYAAYFSADKEASLFAKPHSMLTDCKFDYASLFRVRFSDMIITGDKVSFDSVKQADHCVFDTVNCHPDAKNDLKMKGAKVNDETAEEYRDLWAQRRDPTLAEMAQEIAAREAAAQVARGVATAVFASL